MVVNGLDEVMKAQDATEIGGLMVVMTTQEVVMVDGCGSFVGDEQYSPGGDQGSSGDAQDNGNDQDGDDCGSGDDGSDLSDLPETRTE